MSIFCERLTEIEAQLVALQQEADRIAQLDKKASDAIAALTEIGAEIKDGPERQAIFEAMAKAIGYPSEGEYAITPTPEPEPAPTPEPEPEPTTINVGDITGQHHPGDDSISFLGIKPDIAGKLIEFARLNRLITAETPRGGTRNGGTLAVFISDPLDGGAILQNLCDFLASLSEPMPEPEAEPTPEPDPEPTPEAKTINATIPKSDIDVGPFTVARTTSSIQIYGVDPELSEDIRAFIIERDISPDATYTMLLKMLEFSLDPQWYDGAVGEIIPFLKDLSDPEPMPEPEPQNDLPRDDLDTINDWLKLRWEDGKKSILIADVEANFEGIIEDVKSKLKTLEFMCELTMHDDSVWFDAADIPDPKADEEALKKISGDDVVKALADRFQSEHQLGWQSFLNDYQDKYHRSVEQRLNELASQKIIEIKGQARKRIRKGIFFPKPEQNAA